MCVSGANKHNKKKKQIKPIEARSPYRVHVCVERGKDCLALVNKVQQARRGLAGPALGFRERHVKRRHPLAQRCVVRLLVRRQMVDRRPQRCANGKAEGRQTK